MINFMHAHVPVLWINKSAEPEKFMSSQLNHF